MHIPVLLQEVLEIINPEPGQCIIDGTVGGGGHAEAIIEKLSPGGIFFGLDWDDRLIKKLRQNRKLETDEVSVILENGNYADVCRIMKKNNIHRADALLVDLGFSSDQLNESGRGFSFERDEPLLMTYSDTEKPVREILRNMNEKELEIIIRKLSGERYARNISKNIKEYSDRNCLRTSGQLSAAVKEAVPKFYERGRINPATRTFQALRIFANRELENLEKLLKSLINILNPGGKAAIISFHSLEDRLVKIYFKDLIVNKKARAITKKPIIPNESEIIRNPRCRSAKLRAVEII